MIITRLYGGMGNQMFQYAIGRALAIKNNTILGLDVSMLLDRTPRENFTFREYDLDIFAVEATVLPQTEVKSQTRVMLEKVKNTILPKSGIEKSYHFDESALDLKDGTYLQGYWQSYKYFASVADIIRKDFTLITPLLEHIQTLKEKIINENSVCLHVRRGDYVGNANHDVVDSEYYTKAVELMKSKITIDHLYVFSNDVEWCHSNLSFGTPMTIVGEEYRGHKESGHFELMRACRHSIIANSSFSWWAAWLGDRSDKIVLAPKRWFGGDRTTPDLIPDHWVRI